MDNRYHLQVKVYYEDTDHTGVVYHANYLKYLERAREEVMGMQMMKELWNDKGIGFPVFNLNINYKKGARFGDILDIYSTFVEDGEYKLVWTQEVWVENEEKPIVRATVENVCMTDKGQLRQFGNVLDLIQPPNSQ